MTKSRSTTSSQVKNGNGKATNRISGDATGGGAGDAVEKAKAEIVIQPARIGVTSFRIVGITSYVQNRFTKKAFEQMREAQEKGSTKAKESGKRQPKDFDELYRQSQYLAPQGWNGIPASAFRAAMVDACRLCGFKMTHAKQAFDVIGDGEDVYESKPLIRITKGTPEKFEQPLPNDNGKYDIRVRARFAPGWEAVVNIQHDLDVFTPADIANLMVRAGMQCGIGAGRMSSKKCAGLGWGQFKVEQAGTNT